MSKGKPLGTCQSCHSEIVAGINDGVFRNEECALCERHRYETQPLLFCAMQEIRYATEELEYDDGDFVEQLKAIAGALEDIREVAYRVIKRCELSPASPKHHD